MTEIAVKGTVARVEYHLVKQRTLHVLQDDGKSIAVRLSAKMNQSLPSSILGATVTGAAWESYQPGFFMSNYLAIVEPDVQPLLTYERPIVIVDSQEASINPLLLADLRAFNYDIAVSSLAGSGADLVASSRVGIQLKSNLDDLCGSISDKRVFTEVEELQSSYEIPYLLIVGDTSQRSHLKPQSVAGTLAWLTLAFDRLHIIHMKDRPDAIQFIRSLVKQEQVESKHYPALKEWTRKQDLADAKVAMIAQLPGVGAKTAIKLLKRHGTVEDVAQLHEIDFRQHGVSRPRAKETEKVLHEPYA